MRKTQKRTFCVLSVAEPTKSASFNQRTLCVLWLADAATVSQRSFRGERFAFFDRRALQLLGWYAILVESSGLSVARRSTKTNYN